MELAIEYGVIIILEQPCSFHTIQNSAFIATVPTAEIINGENARAWVSMVLYLKK